MATNVPVTLETPIVVKILFRGQTKKFKLPLKDLGAHVLPDKLRAILGIPNSQEVVFERYSDSAAAYVHLRTDNAQVYKTLFRAAKAKLKLRLKASIPGEVWDAPAPPPPASMDEQQPSPLPSIHRSSAETLAPEGGAPISSALAQSPNTRAPAPKFEPISPSSPTKLADTEGEAPVPRSFTARHTFFNNLASANFDGGLAFRPKPLDACTSWVVYCNNCNHPMEDEHFHCSVCDGGDYDLCPDCVDSGIHCPGKGHWMVKRFVKNGCVVNSTTQRIPPKAKDEGHQEIPGAFTEEKPALVPEEDPTRTCNCCVKVLPEKEFVTCVVCDDYDLCLECHIGNKHGHHPGHVFKAATEHTVLPTVADFLCNSGRNVRHAAVCDGCDKFIYGVRHKCLNCPDWDYCSECIKNAEMIHPRHRFVPIYEPLAEPLSSGNRHYGIYCDGPLCKDKENVSYIEGTRFKCAVCHDTDFCQNCEAHPSNTHNHTHPLIKFKTAVRSVSVTTVNDDKAHRVMARLGDRIYCGSSNRSTATETTPVAPRTNAATQVQTIVDLKPSVDTQVQKEKISIPNLISKPVEVTPDWTADSSIPTMPMDIPVSNSETAAEGLDAHFVRDTVIDGSKIYSGYQFVQNWTMRNPGPNAWPVGCSVRHVGGDNMLNIDNTRPLSRMELIKASESNVIDRVVEPGEEVTFRVVMKAPQREGTAISYWRLKNAGGTPFGHRLWCDIRVVQPPTPVAPLVSPSTLPENATSSPSALLENAPSSPPPLYERLLQARLERMNIAQQSSQQFLDHQKNIRSQVQQLQQHKMERIQRVRKAAVERVMESRRKEHEAALATIQHEEPIAEAEVASPEPVAEKAAEPVAELQCSGMVFPRLDKESPESSTYESSTTVQPESPVSQKSTARTVTVASDDEFFEDAESVALHSDDEGFMTDEEYDILDVSDEENI
ncbi:hypothetical protein J1614_005558 [Plenodomus biglobosus]|nr:hypothetical protein J1614_005558 [Plenodomus biglobosus]